MAEELRAIPDVLCHIGNQLTTRGEELLVLQRACHEQAEGARAGWVGRSAPALSALVDSWATVSNTHLARFGEHASGMRFVAAGLTEMEQGNAALFSR